MQLAVIIIMSFAFVVSTLIAAQQRLQNKELLALNETAISQTKAAVKRTERSISQTEAAIKHAEMAMELARQFEAKCTMKGSEQ